VRLEISTPPSAFAEATADKQGGSVSACMAIFHFSAKVGSRSSGASAAGAAAYASAEKLKDHLGHTHDYTDKDDVVYSGILLPPHAPAWLADRERLWQEVERREDLSTRPESAQLFRQVEVALPRELSRPENIALAREFALNNFVEHGMIVDLNIHEPVSARDGEIQPHAHLLVTMREVSEDGTFGHKLREFNDRAWVHALRESWAEHMNDALERAGVHERVDHRSLEAQGVERIPEPKLGAAAQAMEQRGIVTERGEHLREVQAITAARAHEAASSTHVEQHGATGIEHHATPTVEHESGSHGKEHGHEAGQDAAAEMGMGE